MKFLKTIKKDGAYYCITDAQGNRYRVVQCKIWRKAQILKEPLGHFAIVSDKRESKGFKYDKLLFKDKHIVAYYRNEFELYRYYYIYNEQGRIIYKGKILPNLPSKARIAKILKHHQKYSKNRKYHK